MCNMRNGTIFLNKFYSFEPHGDIATGDIFDNLPTMGLLKEEFTKGIIITPSCDLANKKTETITYLPIVPISSFLCASKGYALIRSEIKNTASQLKVDSTLFDSREMPGKEDIVLFLSQFDGVEYTKDKEKNLKKKLESCLRLIEDIRNVNTINLNKEHLSNIWNKNFENLIKGLITNSGLPDVHFLPRERIGKDECYILKEHSLVLFRYPITIPAEILNVAKDTDQENTSSWEKYIGSKRKVPCNIAFKEIPLRGLQLRQDFLSDLLTRYIALYVRIGSPDFHRSHIETMLEELLNDLN